MKNNYAKHKEKAKRYRLKIEKIQKKYPEINMKSQELFRDMMKLHDLFNRVVYEDVDADECKSDNPDRMCSDCICWKQTRKMS